MNFILRLFLLCKLYLFVLIFFFILNIITMKQLRISFIELIVHIFKLFLSFFYIFVQMLRSHFLQFRRWILLLLLKINKWSIVKCIRIILSTSKMLMSRINWWKTAFAVSRKVSLRTSSDKGIGSRFRVWVLNYW